MIIGAIYAVIFVWGLQYKIGGSTITIIAIFVLVKILANQDAVLAFTSKINPLIKKVFSKVLFASITCIMGIAIAFLVNDGKYDDLTSVDIDKSSLRVRPESTDTIIVHERMWHDFKGGEYHDSIIINQNDYKSSVILHELTKQPRYNSKYWEKVYSKLQEIDHYKLDSVIAMFKGIKEERQVSDLAFAELIITFIQDIKYQLVLEDGCDPGLYERSFVKDYLESCSEACCIGNIKFGVHSPVEFMATLKGDCDTRTLFAHMILSKFGYDVVIMNSNVYLHSMLGIAMPYHGDHKVILGKKYYFLELTAERWKPGELPPDYNIVANWNVELPSINNN